MKFPEYFRQRITSTLWSLGFSVFSFIYCLAVLSMNNFHLSELHRFNQFLQDNSNENGSSQYILGYVILCTYFAQNALWESSLNGCNEIVYYNLLLMTLSIFTYMKG